VTGKQDRGACFGFAVRSSLPFFYLREGDGEPLEISMPSTEGTSQGDRLVCEWTFTDETPFNARLYGNEPLYRLWIEGSGWFVIDPQAPSISLPQEEPEGENAVRREERLWGIPVFLCIHARGDLPLHAAAVEVEGEAILLAAPRTFGKTTLAAGFARAGHRLLSEDLCRIVLSSTPSVVPGPAMLRLRRDVGELLEIPFAKRLDLGDDRVHLALDGALRGNCRPVPIRAIAFLGRSENGFALARVDDAEAVRNLFVLASRLGGDDDCARVFAGVADLASSVPVWSVSYPLALDDLDSTVERIAKGV
jgi:hypothetical protein